MKKSLIALAALAAVSVASAQSTATISGAVSVGIMNNGAVGSKAVVSAFGGGANAVSIVTSEDLGGGLKAGLNSQIRFNGATGDVNSAGTGNALFHTANAYVSGSFGHFSIGKVGEDSNCGFDAFGCNGSAGAIFGAGGTISGGIASGTQAQSVRYATPNIAGFSASYQTSLSTRVNERTVLNISYANGPIVAQFLRSNSSGNVAGNGTAITDVDGKGTSIGASYDLRVVKLAVFNAKTENAASVVTNNITGVTASAPMGAFTVLAAFVKDSKAAANADTKFGLGANYALSKRTTLGADLFKQEGVGRSTGFVARIRHNF